MSYDILHASAILPGPQNGGLRHDDTDRNGFTATAEFFGDCA